MLNFRKILFMKTIGYILVFVFISSSLQGQEVTTDKIISSFSDEAYKELSLSEWKKFKNFELKLSNFDEQDKEQQLRGYVRDSLQILGVKLMAVKLLDEKKLLNKDLSENPEYYVSLLDELRGSDIPKSEYLFLEEKMAYLNQAELQNQLVQSRWLNLGLLSLCLCLGYLTYYWRNGVRKSIPAELSKQEITVRNLILQGKSNKEIANELFISLSTVKSHITNLYAKLNVANRQELFQKSTGAST
ncbi:helix-turn-helix transcriptional regulator [Muricauda sp. DJ-13]|uniref:Helix-turn-helix transcriptional regulator n=2 Tax=Croceivirga thetidis TaxID=2721623 RepID=A0ABX1GN61_9FLAO|nr:helix-turn-helix transcriptional regulator [Croceivirga thetidis]